MNRLGAGWNENRYGKCEGVKQLAGLKESETSEGRESCSRVTLESLTWTQHQQVREGTMGGLALMWEGSSVPTYVKCCETGA